MKHAANRSHAAAKPKAKTLTQIKAIKKRKPVAKKPIGKIALKSRQSTPVKKIKAAAKTTPKNSPRATKPTTKQTVPKLSTKTSDALKTLSARKTKLTAKQADKPKAKKIAPKIPAKTIKTAAQKTKPSSPTPKVKAVEKKIKNLATAQKANSKITTAQSKVSAKPTIKNSIKATKSQSSKVAVRTVEPQLPKTKIAVPAVKFVRQKAKPVIIPKNPVNIGKTRPTVTAKSVKEKNIALTVPTKKVDRQTKQIQPVVRAKKIVKTKKIKPVVAAKKVVRKIAKVKPPVTAEKAGRKIQKLKPVAAVAPVKKRDPKIVKVSSVKKLKPVENVIEATPEPRPPKPKNRKARPISSAVFRGKKEQYDFKVFALNEKFEPIPAVYIISKRKTDRHKRGHHALICIGETASIADELKRHRKGKCVKKHQANVVSILPEADEKRRLKIEIDLKAAHTVACNLD